jgi:ketosteroid isomerase-like protein
MPDLDQERRARRVLDAWNTHDVDAVLACYATDLVYRDPGTRGDVRGADAFRHYLARLFGAWRMHWSAREIFALAGTDGTAVLWSASLTPVGGNGTIAVEGMDLVLLKGGLIARNEVYFDRAALLPMLGGGSAR